MAREMGSQQGRIEVPDAIKFAKYSGARVRGRRPDGVQQRHAKGRPSIRMDLNLYSQRAMLSTDGF